MKTLSTLLLACLLFFTFACDSAEVTPEPEPTLEPNTFAAQLRGAVTADIEGVVAMGLEEEYDGFFVQLDSAHVIEDGVYTLIRLEAESASDRINLVQYGDGLTETSYPVISGPVRADSEIDPPYPFQILYSSDTQSSKATSGSVSFTTATEDKLEGTFEYVGELNGEELRIEGAFTAERDAF